MKKLLLFLLIFTSITFSQSVEIITDKSKSFTVIETSQFASVKVETCKLLLELGSGDFVNFEYRSNGKTTFTTISYGEYVLERVYPCPPFCSGEVFTKKEAEELFGPVISEPLKMKPVIFENYLSECNEILKFRILK